jgi:uncharacterized protein
VIWPATIATSNEGPDQSWQGRPASIPRIVARRAARPIAPRIHTNGVLLDEQTCELVAENGSRLVSPPTGTGPPTTGTVGMPTAAAATTRPSPRSGCCGTAGFWYPYGGLPCPINAANDPVGVYESFVALEPPRIDFLLPQATWEPPPTRGEPEAEYADWLIAIFDRWMADGRPVAIRIFDSFPRCAAGQPDRGARPRARQPGRHRDRWQL